MTTVPNLTAVLVRRDALDALMKLFEGYWYGPGGAEPTEEQIAAGFGELVRSDHATRLADLAQAVEGHERYLKLALNGETTTGVCTACNRYRTLTHIDCAEEVTDT